MSENPTTVTMQIIAHTDKHYCIVNIGENAKEELGGHLKTVSNSPQERV